MPATYAASLAAALSRTPACVGLDPVIERLPEPLRAEHWEPARAIEHFCRAVLDALVDGGRPIVGVVKPQAACFERYGSAGWTALERTVRHARDLGLVVILDAKRGDIGVTAEHYAAAARGLGADAITVNAYLGPETVEPYLASASGVRAGSDQQSWERCGAVAGAGRGGDGRGDDGRARAGARDGAPGARWAQFGWGRGRGDPEGRGAGAATPHARRATARPRIRGPGRDRRGCAPACASGLPLARGGGGDRQREPVCAVSRRAGSCIVAGAIADAARAVADLSAVVG